MDCPLGHGHGKWGSCDAHEFCRQGDHLGNSVRRSCIGIGETGAGSWDRYRQGRAVQCSRYLSTVFLPDGQLTRLHLVAFLGLTTTSQVRDIPSSGSDGCNDCLHRVYHYWKPYYASAKHRLLWTGHRTCDGRRVVTVVALAVDDRVVQGGISKSYSRAYAYTFLPHALGRGNISRSWPRLGNWFPERGW